MKFKNKSLNGLLLCALLACPSALEAKNEVFVPSAQMQHKKAETKAPQYKVVIDEDFSLFTAGSEDAPDSENIANKSYKVNNEYTHEPLWGGNRVYQAGGCAFLGGYKDEYDWQYYGHITTPERELSGELSVSFRARRANSNPNSGKLDLALCDNDYGRIETIKYDLTEEWQEFTWEYTNTQSFSDRCVFQFSAKEGEILLDDIKVLRAQTVIEGVDVMYPINNSPTEFVARWYPANNSNITGYLFNVYYMDMPAEYIEPGTMMCDFESINIDTDGRINSSDPGFPEGWTIDVSSNGNKDVATEAGNYNSGTKALLFDESGDYILSPVAPAPINSISFWVKPTSLDYEVYGETSLLGIWVKYEDESWEHIANINNTYMEEDGGFFTLDGDAIKPGVYQIKLTCQSSFNVDFIIDDVTIDYATQPVAFTVIEDELVTTTSRVVSDIDPSKDYYYYVKVVDGDLQSAPSQHMWVDGIVGVTPEVYNSTDVTKSGFTANWQKLYHADMYTLNVNHEFVTSTDDEEVLLAYEDFSKLTEGTLSWPHYEYWDTYNLAENGYSEQEWVLTLPCWAEGHAGTQGSSWGEPALVMSPKFNLGNYAVKVDFTACNTMPNDTVWVLVLDKYDAVMPKFAKQAAGFDNVYRDHVSASVILDAQEWGNEPLHIAFVSQNNNAFFIDEAKISLIVPEKGTVIAKNYKIIQTENNYYTFENLPAGASVYSYTVKAQATKNFVLYESNVSEEAKVDLQFMSSVSDIEDSGDYLYSKDGELHVVVGNPARVAIYNLQGMLIEDVAVEAGENVVNLPQGMYVVRVSDKTYKVVVK